MKTKKLNIFLVLILSFAVHTIHAQSLQKKFQADNEQRMKHKEALLKKAKEQQAQQQAEKRNDPNIAVPPQASPNNPVQPATQPTNVQQKTNQNTPTVRPDVKKPAPVKRAAANAAARKDDLNQ